MTEAALDQLLASISGGKPVSDLYKSITMTRNKNEFNVEYLKHLTTADLEKEKVKYLYFCSRERCYVFK